MDKNSGEQKFSSKLLHESFDLKEVTWTISNVSSLPHTVGYKVQSLSFPFANANWELGMFPYGEKQERQGYIELAIKRLNSQIPEHFIFYKICFMTSNGEEFQSYSNSTMFKPNQIAWVLARFLKKSQLIDMMNTLAPNGDLTIKCQMHTKKVAGIDRGSQIESGIFPSGPKPDETFEKQSTSICAVLEENCKSSKSQIPLSGPELAKALKIGTRVIRGADWEWDNQDGPYPGEGRVCHIHLDGWVEVKWDNGSTYMYRMGEEEKYDLRLASPLPVQQQDLSSDSVEQNDSPQESSVEDTVSFEPYCKDHDDISQQPMTRSSIKALIDFKQLFLKKEDSDIIINVKGEEFPTHRTILCARSSVFASTFRNDMKEKATGIINIEDCDASSFSDFLCFLYCGHVENLSTENVFSLFVTADKYDVQDLMSECMDFIKKNLSIETFCDTIALALQHSEKELIELSVDYFARNLQEIIKTVKWQSLLLANPIRCNELMIKALSLKN